MTTHSVAVATLPYYLQLRERYIDLQGMPCLHYAVIDGQDLQRADFYGDIRQDLTFKPSSSFKMVVDIPSMVRRVHHLGWASDDWQMTPIIAEVKNDVHVAEGDIVRFNHIWLRNLFGDPMAEALESKYFQIAKVEQGIHVHQVSKIIRLVPYRDTFEESTPPPNAYSISFNTQPSIELNGVYVDFDEWMLGTPNLLSASSTLTIRRAAVYDAELMIPGGEYFSPPSWLEVLLTLTRNDEEGAMFATSEDASGAGLSPTTRYFVEYSFDESETLYYGILIHRSVE